MRQDSGAFLILNQASAKEPRFVISIEFDVESIYLTSHLGIDAVPGVVIPNVLRAPSAISQRILPDEGRSEIGTFSFSLVDVDSVFTDEARERLQANKGLRGRRVRFYLGYNNPSGETAFEGFGGGPFGGGGFGSAVGSYDPPDATFLDFQLFQTQIIKQASFDEGVYKIQCNDITREQRKDILEPKKTTLRDSMSATATTIPVYDTISFHPVLHGTSYSDAPGETVGYIKLEKEIIRWTGKTADSFTGCTRGVLNSKASAHTVDLASDADRRPKVEEVIYLELPAVKAAYAILTGLIWGTGASIPEHWHLGIDPSLVNDSDFTGIGTDLWDPASDTSGFIARFLDLKKTDGKRFLESELFLLLGLYSPIYADGRIGLKRMNAVLQDAASVVTIDERNAVEWGDLTHDFDGMINRFQIDWNWNGEEFTRRTVFIDVQSIETHGTSKTRKLSFLGLHGSRHTDGLLHQRISSIRDRYAEPPELIQVSVLPSLNPLELGDVVRLKLANVRDFAGNTASIDRSFEIQRKSENFFTGNVTLDLFGSTARAAVDSPTVQQNALPDDYYTSEGTELSTVVTIVVVGGVGVIQTGTYNLAGHANLNNAGAIYYYDGDLELSSAAVLTSNNNVQLRVKGHFTINGDIDGVGRGQAGVADSGPLGTLVQGLPGYIGNSRGMDGVSRYTRTPLLSTIPCALTIGALASFPFLDLTVDGNSLLGLPNDLRGTSGGPGGRYAINFGIGTAQSLANGGTGANSGAGLAIICRGLSFGASGSINLSGNSSAATTLQDGQFYPGAGGAGSPGAMFIGLDGANLSIPDLGGKFIAATGAVPINGNPITVRSFGNPLHQGVLSPFAGYLDEKFISAVDHSNAAHRIQYLPATESPQTDQDEKPPTPTDLIVTGQSGFNEIFVEVQNFGTFDTIQVYASFTNNRADSLPIGEGRQTEFRHAVVGSRIWYYWTRTKKIKAADQEVFSDWFPSSATAGVSAGSIIAIPEIAPDLEFALKADQTYWYLVANDGGAAPTIALTGGNIAGKASIVCDGFFPKSVVSRRYPPIQAITGEVWTVKIRWRRTSTIIGAGAFIASITRHAQPPDNAGFDIESATIAVGGVIMTVAEMNARTLNEWQEDAGIALVVKPASYIGAELPYLSLIANTPTSINGGTIEIDLLNAMPGSNGNPHERIYTSGANLVFYDLMKRLRYDSSSAGELTLPNVIDEFVGARIWFEQAGTGLLTIGAPGLSSLFSPPNTSGDRALSGRYASTVAEAKGDFNWYLTGDLA